MTPPEEPKPRHRFAPPPFLRIEQTKRIDIVKPLDLMCLGLGQMSLGGGVRGQTRRYRTLNVPRSPWNRQRGSSSSPCSIIEGSQQ